MGGNGVLFKKKIKQFILIYKLKMAEKSTKYQKIEIF